MNPGRPTTIPRTTRSTRAYVMWGVGMAAYIVAVLHRTSIGVAGLEATKRFHVSASALASFAVLQLLVYAGLQVPVGVLLDRFGARRLIAAGAFLMAAGQVVLALATGLPMALLGRVLVGAGDAMTFISVLTLVSAWFPPRRIPLMSQLTGLLGQLGQVLSAVPLVALLHGGGWTPAFLSVAAVGAVITVVVAAALQDAPAGAPVREQSPSAREVIRGLADAWRHPGTRLGLWTHFVTQFPGTAFAMLWGIPFLVSGERLSTAAASGLLTLFALAGMVVAPVLGELVARHPLRRSWLVLGIVGIIASAWTVVLALPHPAPLWLLVVLVLALALGGPGSMIGFDFARTFNPPHRLGTASGIVNVGGFFASLVTIFAIGLVLDALAPAGRSAYTLADFRIALTVQYAIWLIGVAGVLRTRALARAELARDGIVVPPIREALQRERAARRRKEG